MEKEAIKVLDYNGLEYLIGKIKGEISGEEHDYTVFDIAKSVLENKTISQEDCDTLQTYIKELYIVYYFAYPIDSGCNLCSGNLYTNRYNEKFIAVYLYTNNNYIGIEINTSTLEVTNVSYYSLILNGQSVIDDTIKWITITAVDGENYRSIKLYTNGDGTKVLADNGRYVALPTVEEKDYTVFDIIVNATTNASITQENYDKLVSAAGDEMISADCRPYGGQNQMMYDFCVLGKSSDGGIEAYMRANNYALMNYCNYVVYVNISSTLSVTSTITSNAIIADSAGDVSVMADGESVMLKKSGDGNSYLADDGTYRAIDLSSYATAASVTAIENQIGNISTLLTTINGE